MHCLGHGAFLRLRLSSFVISALCRAKACGNADSLFGNAEKSSIYYTYTLNTVVSQYLNDTAHLVAQKFPRDIMQ